MVQALANTSNGTTRSNHIGLGTMAANAAGHRTDTGAATAEQLDQTRMALKQAYAPPVRFENQLPASADNTENIPANLQSRYNFDAPFPMKYDMPSLAKENLVAREALRRQAPGPEDGKGVQLMDTISQDEVEYLKGMEKQAKLADYDRYVSSFIDTRQPGQLKFLYEQYPDMVHRQIAQVQQDFDYAMRLKLISMYGIQDKSDMDFLYAVDQGHIEGPTLQRPARMMDSMYKAGFLSPFAKYQQRAPGGLKLPFANASEGFNEESAGVSMSLQDGLQPLSSGRDIDQMAKAYWNSTRTGGDNTLSNVGGAFFPIDR